MPVSAAEYWAMYDRGEFAFVRVELFGGEIREWPPRSNFHACGIALIEESLESIFESEQFWVRNQGTLDLTPDSVVDPDITVVFGSKREWSKQPKCPTTALLIVEVSELSLEFDRTRKASLYAASGIADYRILNIPDRQLEIRRDPRPDATQEFGHGYASLATLQPGDFATPLALPGAKVAVADLLPT
jgi:Putative restriction endonuclease